MIAKSTYASAVSKHQYEPLNRKQSGQHFRIPNHFEANLVKWAGTYLFSLLRHPPPSSLTWVLLGVRIGGHVTGSGGEWSDVGCINGGCSPPLLQDTHTGSISTHWEPIARLYNLKMLRHGNSQKRGRRLSPKVHVGKVPLQRFHPPCW